MIQRLQSLFLLLAAVCFGLEFVFPFASTDQAVTGLFSDSVYNVFDHIALIVLSALGGVVCIIIIALYQKRERQLRFSYLALTLAILLPLIAILIYSNQTANMGSVEVSDQAGLYLPIGMILFLSLAIRYIKKDEKLVRSMDRLR